MKPLKIANEYGQSIELTFDAAGRVKIRHHVLAKKQIHFCFRVVGIWISCFYGFVVCGAVTFTNLFSFSGTNGITPEGRLLQTADGILYGTARDTTLEKWGNANFGFNGDGTIFKITTNGEFSLLATFVRTNGNGAYPRAGLTLGDDGNLYGTTAGGGVNRNGTIFQVTTNGGLTILALFGGTNGSIPSPVAGLVKAREGIFFGTTMYGGLKDRRIPDVPYRPSGWGTVFSLNPQGMIDPLVFFDNTNGTCPDSGLIRGSDGSFYGTTTQGGLKWLQDNNLTNEFCEGGFGTVFKMTPDGKLSTLVAFNGYNGIGGAAIAQGQDGSLFGITTRGGATNTASRYEEYAWSPFRGEGTIFKIAPNGKFTTLVLFYGANGKNPESLILGKDGNLYGTTAGGGANNLGTIFRLTPNGKFTTLYSLTESGGTWPNRSIVMQGNDGNLYGTTTRCGKNQCGSIFRLTIN